tara:strand:- start:63 stop:443 length:381 start_codon:yes stop_codon:yes gene_type:complete
MKLSQILQIEHILSGRAIPSDMFDEHKVYYSKSRDKWIAIVDMEPTHLIRAFVKLQEENKILWEEQCEANQALLDDTDKEELVESINKRIKNLEDEVSLLVDLFHDDKAERIKEKELWAKAKGKMN